MVQHAVRYLFFHIIRRYRCFIVNDRFHSYTVKRNSVGDKSAGQSDNVCTSEIHRSANALFNTFALQGVAHSSKPAGQTLCRKMFSKPVACTRNYSKHNTPEEWQPARPFVYDLSSGSPRPESLKFVDRTLLTERALSFSLPSNRISLTLVF